ncbi:MAG: hypothetical protein JSS96_13075, partial [Bacteroidetes bacterium]|nr:hypothetical protein [Bacteroidota bacterium]
MISNFKLRKLLLFFALLMSVFGSNVATAATKYTSAEMYADYIGTGVGDYRYRVTLIVYAACISSAPAPAFNSTETVCWESSCYTTSKSKSLKLVHTDTLDNMYCSSVTNSCRDASSSSLGFGMAVYSDTISLANYPCEDWQIDWHGTPRDNSTNLLGSSNTIDIRCQIYNKGANYNTSTPRYLDRPKFNLCQNSRNGITLSPFDPNGDSLSTIIINPYNGTGCFTGHSKVNYASGYGTNYPIDAPTDPFTVNSYTGYSTVTPMTAGNKYNITYETDKFDPFTGTWLGYCQRDMEYFIQTCATAPPYTDSFIANLGGGATYDSVNHVIQVCPNVNFSFDVHAYGGSGTSALSLTSDNQTTAPGSNFPATYITTGRADTMLGTFSWKASSKDIGLHIVTFHIKDSACTSGDQIPTADFSVVISVGYSPDAGPDQAYCPGKSNSLPPQLNVTGFPPGSNFYWYNAAYGVADSTISDSLAQNPIVTPTVTTDYVVYVTDASGNPLPCKSTDTVRVRVFPPQTVSAGPDQTICLNQSITLKPVIPTTKDSVYWSPDPTLSNDSITNPYAKPTVYGKTTYFAYFIDINKCHYFDSTHVITNGIAPKILTSIVPDTVCPGGTAQLNVTVQEQGCGAASAGSCKGTATDLAIDGPSKRPMCGSSGSYSFGDPTPYYYYYYSAGGRMQLIYTKAELEAAGLQAGYINSIS